MGQKRKSKNTIFFEEEIVRKEDAGNILNELKQRQQEEKKFKSKQKNAETNEDKKKRRKTKRHETTTDAESETHNEQKDQEGFTEVKKKKKKNITNQSVEDQNSEIGNVKIKVKKAKRDKSGSETTEELVTKKSKKRKNEVEEIPNGDVKKKATSTEETVKSEPKESKRSLKKKKYAKLLDEKKSKADLKMQENVLNYLSKWKHARNEWKFEKLKQIWLQQNIFAVHKIPDEIWQAVVEYFNGSRGAIRNAILTDALKIIEEDHGEEQTDDENYQTRLTRARDMVQSLEE